MLHLLTQNSESPGYRRFRLDLLPEPDDLDPDDRLLPDVVDERDELPDERTAADRDASDRLDERADGAAEDCCELSDERTAVDREAFPELPDDCLGSTFVLTVLRFVFERESVFLVEFKTGRVVVDRADKPSFFDSVFVTETDSFLLAVFRVVTLVRFAVRRAVSMVDAFGMDRPVSVPVLDICF
jgi:hypothetical protein